MPNVMLTLPSTGGSLCSTPQSLADAHYYMPCSNAAKTRKQLKVAGVPQTPETISAASGLKFTIRVRGILRNAESCERVICGKFNADFFLRNEG